MMTTKINQLMFTALMIHVSGAVASAVRSLCMRIPGERIVACESRKFYILTQQNPVNWYHDY